MYMLECDAVTLANHLGSGTRGPALADTAWPNTCLIWLESELITLGYDTSVPIEDLRASTLLGSRQPRLVD